MHALRAHVARERGWIAAYLLLLERGDVTANGPEPGQLRVLSYHPLDELAQRQQQRVPVLGVALQAVPAIRSRRLLLAFFWNGILSGRLCNGASRRSDGLSERTYVAGTEIRG